MPEIYQGVDCTRRLKKPRIRLKLERTSIYAQPEERLRLALLDVPSECDAFCYHWVHVRGGGYLDSLVGKVVRFTAPKDNLRCRGTAVIRVFYGARLLDTVVVSLLTTHTPGKVLRWYEQNRTWPYPPADFEKYRAYRIRSMALYTSAVVRGKRVYTSAPEAGFPNPDPLYMLSRSYDCNGILLTITHHARFGQNTSRALAKVAFDQIREAPMFLDIRTPFLKGEPVTVDEGFTIPFDWRPDTRRLPGLNVPRGTIWPEGWEPGDALPHWECCPTQLFEPEVI